MKTILVFSFIIFSCISACVSDKEEGVFISDAVLNNQLQNITSFTYYKNNTDTLISDQSSPHFPYVRIRFNPKAMSAMNNSADKLLSQSFPDESMIVKEIYNQKGGSLLNYAVMYKLRNAVNNGSGWIWSEIEPDGNVIYSASRKGDQCVSCHASGTNSDLVRTFGLH